jgi:hypothetical protein
MATFHCYCCYIILARRQSESGLVGGNDNSGRQLRPDGIGAYHLAVGYVGGSEGMVAAVFAQR